MSAAPKQISYDNETDAISKSYLKLNSSDVNHLESVAQSLLERRSSKVGALLSKFRLWFRSFLER